MADGSDWDHDAGYTDEWEVICPCTGDDGGPDFLQSEDVRSFRGPYATRERARTMAHHHNVVAHWD
jgi:hypothetical protein